MLPDTVSKGAAHVVQLVLSSGVVSPLLIVLAWPGGTSRALGQAVSAGLARFLSIWFAKAVACAACRARSVLPTLPPGRHVAALLLGAAYVCLAGRPEHGCKHFLKFFGGLVISCVKAGIRIIPGPKWPGGWLYRGSSGTCR